MSLTETAFKKMSLIITMAMDYKEKFSSTLVNITKDIKDLQNFF